MSYIDTRDLAEELDELEARRAEIRDAEAGDEIPDWDDDDTARLEVLRELRDEISDWRHGETMIPESEFEDYARELAEDIGAVPADAGWPAYCIDWERAARELSMDYTLVTLDGTDYYVRS